MLKFRRATSASRSPRATPRASRSPETRFSAFARRATTSHIDDFGTGYSSLAYLHDLSVDAIKIDKAFTKAIGTDAVTVSILPQILTMAETLKLRVVVEGIETQAQADYFAASNQRIHAQGWLFGRPVPARLFLQMLDEEEARIAREQEEQMPNGAAVAAF